MIKKLPSGRTVTKAIAATAVVWDLLCEPGDTVSQVLGEALADRRSRGPLLFAAAVLTLHIVGIAVRTGREEPPIQIPLGSPGNLGLERFEVLRGLGWPA
jgi:hypothetical protein